MEWLLVGRGIRRGGTSDGHGPAKALRCKLHQFWLQLATERPEVGTTGSLWGEVVDGDSGGADQVPSAHAPLPPLTPHPC